MKSYLKPDLTVRHKRIFSGCTSIVSVGSVIDHSGEDVDEKEENSDKEGGPAHAMKDKYLTHHSGFA